MPTDTASGASPLVSIICRTIGRSELEQAVSSVAAQTHENIELVLVDAGNAGLDSAPGDIGTLKVTIVNTGEQLSRAAAANAGLENSSGSYLMFLDDDDWIAPDHVSGLLAALNTEPEFRAAYSNTQKTDASGTNPGYIFEQDFDPAMLLRDNYVPIHAMLFERSLYEQGCRFDDHFDIFEDWDFWIQLSLLTPFKHITAVTAFYREGGDSETSAENINVRYDNDSVMGKARIKIFNKWLEKWSGEQVNSMLASLDEGSIVPGLHEQLKELNLKLNAEHETNLKHQEQISNQLKELEQVQHELNIESGKRNELEEKLAHSEEKAAQLGAHTKNLESQNTELERNLVKQQEMLQRIWNSTSWKITAPLRGIGRLFNRSTKGSDTDS